MSYLFRCYQRVLARRPILTQAVSAGVLAGVGDIFSQVVVEKRRKRDYDPLRTVRFVGVISSLVAPPMYFWFRFLERFRGPLYPLKRMLIDQTVAAPICLFSITMCLRLFEGFPLAESFNGARARFPPILLTNYKIWPLVQLVNFYIIPLHYRIVFVQFIGIFWNAYLSYMTQSTAALH